jgi:hypothetical protein
MKTVRILVSVIMACGVMVAVHGQANATTNNLSCEVYARSYSVGADTVTAIFEVKKIDSNVASCTKDVTVASWDAPNLEGTPYSAQKFVDSKSGTFAPGYHSLTVKKPQCFYQIDLLRGLSPFGANGGHNNYADWQFVSSNHGGTECKPTPVPQPQPQPTPTTPVTTAGTTPTPTQTIPSTGAEDVIGLGIAASAGGGVWYELYTRFTRRRRD